jgi:predicted porin
MSKRLLIGASVLVLAMAVQASEGTSTLTMYGRVDAGAEYVDRVVDPVSGRSHSLKRSADNQWGTSMLGFKGEESLDARTRAYFLLESGFSATKGVPNSDAFFSRRAYVGLASTDWGMVKLGKDLFNSNDTYYIDPTGHQYIGSATLIRGRSWAITDNLLGYTTPTWNGLSLDVNVALGERERSRALRSEGVSLVWKHDDLELRAIYNARRDARGKYSDAFNYSKEALIGAAYKYGPTQFYAAVEELAANDAASDAPRRVRHGWFGVRHQATKSLSVFGAVYGVDAGTSSGKAALFAVGADYYLSTRTFLYATAGGVNNSANGNFAAEISVAGPGTGQSQRAVYAGMGHRF